MTTEKETDRKIVMLFEVYRDNRCLMSTEYEACIPPIDIIKSMKAAGYKVLLNEKSYKITKDKKQQNNKAI